MPTVRTWKAVAVAMQSAIAAAATISTVAVGATATVTTSAAHGYANGDYVLITANGMRQIDGRVFRVSASASTTFVLEGENTTGYDAFTGGTVQKITFGTSIGTMLTVNAAGGEFDFIDTTTIHATGRTQIPGLPSASVYNFDNIWDVTDAGLVAMKNATDLQVKRCFKFTFGIGGPIMVFNGYPACSLLPGGSAQDKVTTPSSITMDGTPTYYAS